MAEVLCSSSSNNTSNNKANNHCNIGQYCVCMYGETDATK